MKKNHYNLMCRPPVIVPCLAVLVFGSAPRAQQQPATLRTAALESHEGVTISADPWTDAAKYKEKFPKKSPFAAGIVAVDVTIRNDSDNSMRVGLDRIRLNILLSEDNRQGLASLTPDELADVVMGSGKKGPSAKRSRLPIPTGGPKVGKDKHWIEVQKAAAESGMPGSIVAPHSSMHGLLFFDLQGQFDLLGTAHLYIPDVTALEKNHPLLFFEIDLSQPAVH
jgi:hypothetical protein